MLQNMMTKFSIKYTLELQGYIVSVLYTQAQKNILLKCYRKHVEKHWLEYRQISNIRHTLVGNDIVDHSDVDGASPVGAAQTRSSFST